MSSKVLTSDEQKTHEIYEFPYRTMDSSKHSATAQQWVAAEAAAERVAYEQGYQEGERAAVEAAELRLAPVRQRLEGSIREISSLRPDLYIRSEQELVKLTLSIAAKILRREIRLDNDIVSTLIRISLEKLSQSSGARVRLNPDDYLRLASAQAEGAESAFGPGVVLVEDADIELGGCVVETDVGNADARIDAQLHEIAENLLSTF